MKSWGSEVLTSSDMNTYLRDNIEYLKARSDGVTFSGVQLNRTGNQTIADATDTDVAWQAESLDVGGWWSSGATITVPASAVPSGFTTVALDVFIALRYETDSAGGRAALLLVNGSTVDTSYVGAAADTFTGVQLVTTIVVSAADTIKVQTRQNSGGNLDMDVAKIRLARRAPVA